MIAFADFGVLLPVCVGRITGNVPIVGGALVRELGVTTDIRHDSCARNYATLRCCSSAGSGLPMTWR